MNKRTNLRQERRRTARSMTLVAVGGIFGVLAIAAVAVWINWSGDASLDRVTTEVDPMSMVG